MSIAIWDHVELHIEIENSSGSWTRGSMVTKSACSPQNNLEYSLIKFYITFPLNPFPFFLKVFHNPFSTRLARKCIFWLVSLKAWEGCFLIGTWWRMSPESMWEYGERSRICSHPRSDWWCCRNQHCSPTFFLHSWLLYRVTVLGNASRIDTCRNPDFRPFFQHIEGKLWNERMSG